MLPDKIKEWLRDEDNRKKFLRESASRFTSQTIAVRCGTTGWQERIKSEYLKRNPRFGGELLIIGYGIQHFFRDIFINNKDTQTVESILISLHERYFPKIERRYLRIEGTDKVNQLATYTDYLEELIGRGFIHEQDAKPFWGYYIAATQFRLYYKGHFKTLDEAEKQHELVKLLNYTKIIN